MKKVFLLLVAASCFAACKNADQTTDAKNDPNALSDSARLAASRDSANFTTIEWLDSTSRSLGKETEGKKVEILYHFKNSGDRNLVLSDVSASCGCTTPEWPRHPIAPGQEGVVKAVFDSKGKSGTQHKQVFVMANTKPDRQTILSFNVDIVK